MYCNRVTPLFLFKQNCSKPSPSFSWKSFVFKAKLRKFRTDRTKSLFRLLDSPASSISLSKVSAPSSFAPRKIKMTPTSRLFSLIAVSTRPEGTRSQDHHRGVLRQLGAADHVRRLQGEDDPARGLRLVPARLVSPDWRRAGHVTRAHL